MLTSLGSWAKNSPGQAIAFGLLAGIAVVCALYVVLNHIAGLVLPPIPVCNRHGCF